MDASSGPVTSVWAGEDGFERFRRLARVVVPDPASFRFEAVQAEAEGVSLVRVTTSALAGEAAPAGDEPEAVRLDILRTGTGRYRMGDRTYVVAAGSAHLLPTTHRVRFVVTEPSEVLRIVLPLDVLPEPIRRHADDLFGPLEPSPLIDTLGSLVEWGLDEAERRSTPLASKALRNLSIAALQAALLARRELELRDRIIIHIDLHLDEQDLTPTTIADAFDISVRWLHRVFASDATTVGRHIRMRRAEEAAGLLRTGFPATSVTTLAQRVGFGSRTQLARAFQERYGTDVQRYAAAPHDDSGTTPQPVADPASAGRTTS